MRCNIIREPEGGGLRWVKLGERDVDFQVSVDGFLNFDGFAAVIVSVEGELSCPSNNDYVKLCATTSLNEAFQIGRVTGKNETGYVSGHCFLVSSDAHGWLPAVSSYSDIGNGTVPDALICGGGYYNGHYGSFRGHQTVYGLKLG